MQEEAVFVVEEMLKPFKKKEKVKVGKVKVGKELPGYNYPSNRNFYAHKLYYL